MCFRDEWFLTSFNLTHYLQYFNFFVLYKIKLFQAYKWGRWVHKQ